MTDDNQLVSPSIPAAALLTSVCCQISLRSLRYQGRRNKIHYSRLPSAGMLSASLSTVRTDLTSQVLHFSLLRFVFSAVDFERSKSNHAISYPLKLNMGQFLPIDDRGKPQEIWYDLKGVLMHKGKSAHHGHYVAQVHDNTSVTSLPSFRGQVLTVGP